MAELRWDLDKVLAAHGITRYELAQNMSGNVKTRLTSLYRTKNQRRVDLTVMGEIVGTLRQMTGEEVTPNDLLEFVPDPAPPSADAESDLWLDTALTPPLEFAWGPEGEPEGRPVEFVPGEGLYIYDDGGP